MGGNYDVYGPIIIQVVSGSNTRTSAHGAAGRRNIPELGYTPILSHFCHIRGLFTQTVAVVSSNGSVTYTAAVQVTIAQVSWLTVGTRAVLRRLVRKAAFQ